MYRFGRVFRSRYYQRASLYPNYKLNGARGRYSNVKRHAGVMVRYVKRINKRAINRARKFDILKRGLR